MNYFLAIGIPQLILILFVLLPTIIALIDIVRNEFSGNNKIVWLLAVLLGSCFGAFLYFIFGRKQKLPKTNNTV